MLMSQKAILPYVLNSFLLTNQLANIYQHAIETARQQRMCSRELAAAALIIV